MSRFIKRVLGYTLPVLGLIVLAEVLLRHIPNDYAYKKNYLDKHAGEIEVLILGNSHDYYGFDPTLFKLKTFNAAYASQSLNFDWEILKRYEGKLKNLRFIVLPADYFTLTSSLENGEEKWRIKDYNIYFDISLNASFTDNFEVFTGKTQSKLVRLKNFYVSKKKLVQCNKLGFGSGFHSSHGMDLEKTGKLAAKRHTWVKGKVNSFDKNTQLIHQFEAFAVKHKVQLIFVASPVYVTYSKPLNKSQLQRTHGFFKLQAIKNKLVHYYNFMNNTRFKAEDFYDGDHLNEKGAAKFSGIVDSLIQTL